MTLEILALVSAHQTVAVVIGGAIALASGVVFESLRGRAKRKNIAKVLYFEICTIERGLGGLVPLARTTLERGDHPAIIPQELYPSCEPYFAFRADIADFGADISDRLCAFYTRLVEAEHERILILNSINQSIVKGTVIDSSPRLCQAIIDLSGGLGHLKAPLARLRGIALLHLPLDEAAPSVRRHGPERILTGMVLR